MSSLENLKQYIVAASGKMRQPAFDLLNEQVELLSWQQGGRVPAEQFDSWLAKADALYSAGNIKIDAGLLEKAPKLKVIAQASVGYDNIDVAACTARGIKVGNTPGVLNDAVADLAYGLIIDCARHIVRGSEHVKSGLWGQRRGLGFGSDLAGKTLGIVGMGGIGQEIALRAQASKMRVIYHNRHRRSDEAQLGVSYAELEDLLAQSDFVVAAVTLNPSTKGMFNERTFAMMKPTASFINVARGAVVDTHALYLALKEGRLAAAALDVTEPEPLPGEHELLTLQNVTVTPHIASSTTETRDAMALLTAENILAGLRGERLPAQVNEIKE